MQLITKLQHLCNQKVQIGEKEYDVDESGVIASIDDADAHVLLSHTGDAWNVHDPASKTLADVRPKRAPIKPVFSSTTSPTADLTQSDVADLKTAEAAAPLGDDGSGDDANRYRRSTKHK